MSLKWMSVSVMAILAAALPALAQTARTPQTPSFAELARGSLSQLSGTLTLPGLQQPVEVIRDGFGVPHIYARNTHDLFFAQGFVIAQDRLWQMEMTRHVTQGRVSELIGEAGLPHDRLVRTLRFRGPFDDAEWTNYHPEARLILQAYVAGVNAYIAQAGDNLPVEFKLTGHRPQPWAVEEILTRARVSAAVGAAQQELRLARDVAALGAEEANRRAAPDPHGELVPASGVDFALINDEVINSLNGEFRGDFPRPDLLPVYESLRQAWANLNEGAPELAPGSNNWAVRGALTASGSAIMVDDPHRQVTLPAWRYLIHLNAPTWNVIGATEPGLPGVIRGHNGHVSWGRTATGTDEADVYIETLNPQNPDELLWRGAWEPVRVETEVIRVRGGEPVLHRVRIGRHGPLFFQDSANNVAYALRSSLHEQGTAEYIGALRLNQASGARDCLEMGRYVKSPPTNLVCADVSGNIGFQVTAAAPDRPNWNGRLPVPGAGGDYEWRGLRPSEDLPREYNPERNFIATANNNIHPTGWARPLFYNKKPPYWRVDRIAELLEAGQDFTPQDMVAILRDNFRGASIEWRPRFAGWTAADPRVDAARQAVAEWDGMMVRQSMGAAVFHLWLREIDPAAVRVATPDQARVLVEDALSRVVEEMTRTQGTDMAQWRYGRIHTSVFAHPRVSAYDLPDMERDGGLDTVNATGSVYRLVTDFSDLDASLVTLGPGQSGQPESPYYSNLLEDWREGRFFKLHYSRQAVEANRRHVLTLTPSVVPTSLGGTSR